MDTSKITIETENLILKSITMAAKNNIFKEFSQEIATYTFLKSAEKIEDTIKFIKKAIAENKNGHDFQAVIFNKENKIFLGCGVIHQINKKNPELGIWIKKTAQGNGYGKEAVVALKNWADDNLKYDHLLYSVDERNYASKPIPEFFGAKVYKKYNGINMSGKKLHYLEYRIFNKKIE